MVKNKVGRPKVREGKSYKVAAILTKDEHTAFRKKAFLKNQQMSEILAKEVREFISLKD